MKREMECTERALLHVTYAANVIPEHGPCHKCQVDLFDNE